MCCLNQLEGGLEVEFSFNFYLRKITVSDLLCPSSDLYCGGSNILKQIKYK